MPSQTQNKSKTQSKSKATSQADVSQTVAPQTVAPQTVTPQTVAPQTVTPQTVTPQTVTKQSGKSLKGKKQTTPVVEQSVESAPVVQTPVVEPTPVVQTPVVEPVVQTEAPTEDQTGGKKRAKKAVAKKAESKGKRAMKAKVPKQEEKVDHPEEGEDKRMRSFKVRLPGEEEFVGRFTGLTPYQAANKALSKFYRDNKDSNLNVVSFTIKESTRGSKRGEYVYNGKREKLSTPVTYPIENAQGEVRVITKSFKNKLTKVKKNELTSQVKSA